jgi:hypothetical protein
MYPEFDPNIKTCAFSQEFLRQNPQWLAFIEKYNIVNILDGPKTKPVHRVPLESMAAPLLPRTGQTGIQKVGPM